MEVINEGETSLSPRPPFKNLISDSPMANKKRKQLTSPDCRNAKQAKINSTKENEDEIQICEEDKTDLNKSVEKKQTPGRGKTKKLENKNQTNLLTKFLKKVDKVEADAKSQLVNGAVEKKQNEKDSSPNSSSEIIHTVEVHTEKIHIDKDHTDEIQNMKKDCLIQDVNIVLEKIDATKNFNLKKNDSKSEDSTQNSNEDHSSNDKEESNIDSDGSSSLSDDDSGKLSTDRRTDHEDTDSKDSNSKKLQALTPKAKLDTSEKVKKLTPKQVEKKQESQKKREAREKQRLEREKKLQEERENRKKEKEEKKRERDEKKREKEEKEKNAKEQKRLEREQKELEKQAEIERKQKEKEAKEENRRKREEAKEEEKRQKEEEKKRKEEEKLEAERKKQKAASNFVSFFVPKKPIETKTVEEEKKTEKTNFMPFEVKADMRIAPSVRRNLNPTEKSKLEEFVNSGNVDKSDLYTNEIKSKNYTIRKSSKTWPFAANDDVVVIEEGDDDEGSNVVRASTSIIEKHRPKLLMFQDNRRPPYWGTWRKKSKSINPRRPFAKDTECFDYEVDSDDEWEEEEPGESINGSDDEKDKDEDADDNEYDVDNDFMVPHGYLSDEEIVAEDDEEDDDLNPEKQKKKLEVLGKEFEAEMKAKTQKLKPKVIGCVWLNENNEYPENTPERAIQILTSHRAWVRNTPIKLTPPAEGECPTDESGTPSTSKPGGVASSVRKARALEDSLPQLIRLLHGNRYKKKFIVEEFVSYWEKLKGEKNVVPKIKFHEKIKEIATYKSCPELGNKSCWYVEEEFRRRYCPNEEFSFPNSWTYVLPVPRYKNGASDTGERNEEKDKEKKLGPLITQFTKTIESPAEKTSSPFANAEQSSGSVTPISSKQPKRATFITLSSPGNSPASTSEQKVTPTSSRQPKRATLITLSSPGKSASSTTSSQKVTPTSSRQPKRVSLLSVSRGESLPKSPRMSLMDKFIKKDKCDIDDTTNQTEKSNKNDDCMIIDGSDEKIDISSLSSEKGKKEISELAKKIDEPEKPNSECNESENDKLEKISNSSSDVEIVDN